MSPIKFSEIFRLHNYKKKVFQSFFGKFFDQGTRNFPKSGNALSRLTVFPRGTFYPFDAALIYASRDSEWEYIFNGEILGNEIGVTEKNCAAQLNRSERIRKVAPFSYFPIFHLFISNGINPRSAIIADWLFRAQMSRCDAIFRCYVYNFETIALAFLRFFSMPVCFITFLGKWISRWAIVSWKYAQFSNLWFFDWLHWNISQLIKFI